MNEQTSNQAWRKNADEQLRERAREYESGKRARSNYSELDSDVATRILARLKTAEEKLEQQQEVAQKIQRSNDEVSQGLESMKGEIKSERLQATQILALFIGFFTFVSIQFQLFASVEDAYTMVSLSVVLLGGLLVFVSLTYLGVYFIRSEPKGFREWFFSIIKKGTLYILFIAIALFITGIFMSSSARENLQARKSSQVEACDTLTERIQNAIYNDAKTAIFLQEQYENECANIWAK